MHPREEMSEKTDRLINWNKLEAFLNLIVGMFGIAAAVGVYYVLQYRMDRAEISIVEMRRELETVRTSGEDNTKLLIRIDERMKSIQRALKITPE